MLGQSFRVHNLLTKNNGPETKDHMFGFTLVEILIVVVIITMTAAMVIPMMGSTSSMQINSAANMIVSDLEYAKSMATGRQQNYIVVFDVADNSYEIKDFNSLSGTWEVIDHPIKKGFKYAVDFSSDSRLDKVDIDTMDFDPGSSDTITFDYFGSPYSGTGTVNPLSRGEINLQADGATITISVEPVTGYISISN